MPETNSKDYILCMMIGESSSSTYQNFFDELLGKLARLGVPCVFINGGCDIRPNWPTQQLAGLIPKGKYIEIPGAAHYIWLTHAHALRHKLREAVRYVIQEDDGETRTSGRLENG